MAEAGKLSLQYAPRPRIGRAWRAVAKFLVVATAGGLIYLAGNRILWKMTLLIHQRDCLQYTDAQTTLPVFGQDLLLRLHGYISTDGVPNIEELRDPDWREFLKGHSGYQRFGKKGDALRVGRLVARWNTFRDDAGLTEPNRIVPNGTIFLGMLQTPAGEQRLVNVSAGWPEWGMVSRLVLIVHVVRPAGFLSHATDSVQTADVWGEQRSIASLGNRDLRIFPGVRNNDDPGMFEASVTLESRNDNDEKRVSGHGVLVGKLTESDSLQLSFKPIDAPSN